MILRHILLFAVFATGFTVLLIYARDQSSLSFALACLFLFIACYAAGIARGIGIGHRITLRAFEIEQ